MEKHKSDCALHNAPAYKPKSCNCSAKPLTIFQKELSQIHDKDIKQFVIECFDKFCPDYFWTCPCSTTGKYHPQVSLGVGGLVRHIKLAVWWGIELLRALGTSPELKNIPTLQDEVIATLLLHDMVKNGKGLGSDGRPFDRGVTGTHGVTLAKKLSGIDLKLNEDTFVRIYYGIACHMGIWTTDPLFKINGDITLLPTRRAFVNLIHLADYCASRKVDSIYSDLEQEKTNDIIKSSTISTGQNADVAKETPQSPPCPGVRYTKKGPCSTTESQ